MVWYYDMLTNFNIANISMTLYRTMPLTITPRPDLPSNPILLISLFFAKVLGMLQQGRQLEIRALTQLGIRTLKTGTVARLHIK